jgi:hypothetical protein
VRLDDRIQLLHDDEPPDPGGELSDEPLRQGVRHAEFQDGGVREGLADVLVGDPDSDDAERPVAPLDPVPGETLRELAERAHRPPPRHGACGR